jgi:alkylmercury lyase
MGMTDIGALIERVLDEKRLPWTDQDKRLSVVAIRELAHGEPVPAERIASGAGLPVGEAEEFLRRSTAELDDSGRLLGLGLTLRPTPHRFELDGRVLYTWCAPDALAFPVLLGTPAQVESPCFATGATVRLEADPAGVRHVGPTEAVVSVVTSWDVALHQVRQRVCDQQHFFASAEAAAGWLDERPDATIVSVRDGFELSRALVTRWLETPGLAVN